MNYVAPPVAEGTALGTSPPPGLSPEAVAQSRATHGPNVLINTAQSGVWVTLKEVVTEPMFLLLLVACSLYLGLGQTAEAFTLAVALLLVSGISVYQSVRSNRALDALRDQTQPRTQVRRQGTLTIIPVEEVVVGDTVLVSEGERIPADGTLGGTTDFSVDEAILTGESVAVSKLPGEPVFAGTHTATGGAWLTVTAVGGRTELGKIGRSMERIGTEKTPLQAQISRFVGRMAWVGVGAFALVFGINYVRSGDWTTALLFGLTLAMSILPEEIPVAFSSFMALGAARLSRMGVLTKQPQTVESLGSATVICTDKTGTITQDGMSVRALYDGAANARVDSLDALSDTATTVLAYARWASETDPFDAMEKAIAVAYEAASPSKPIDTYPMVHEYPLAGTPPMMTHVRRSPSGEQRVAAKGAVEHVLAVCRLDGRTADQVRAETKLLSEAGLRVLGVAQGTCLTTVFPASQDEFAWSFLGLIAFENPPKANAAAVIRAFVNAGIRVKLITGDYSETAQAIARQVGLPGADHSPLTGQQVMAMDVPMLQAQAAQTAVFARMFPEAKLRVVQALKANGEVVAMTGDGVNDGPALKAAHIGVAMGRRGTEVAKQVASLILVHDDLGGMVRAIALGRRIYQNLKRAVGYIVSIHIPIILTVALPLLLGWRYANVFSPIHVIFLELVMGPTCSIAFENEPADRRQMRQLPRRLTDTFFKANELTLTVVQGLVITAAVLCVYWQTMQAGQALEQVRTQTFLTLVLSNGWLTLVSRSDRVSVWRTLRRPNPLLWLMLGLTGLLLLLIFWLPPVRHLAQFVPLTLAELGCCLLWSVLGVGWIEGWKAIRQRRAPGRTA